MEAIQAEKAINNLKLNFRLSPFTYLSDLIKLENSEEIRYEIGCLYLSQITRGTPITFSSTLDDSSTIQISLLQDWNAILKSNSTLLLIYSDHSNSLSSRQHLKQKFSSQAKTKIIQEYAVDISIFPTYSILAVCKLWIQFQDNTLSLLHKLNYKILSSEINKDLEQMIITRSKIPLPLILSKLGEARTGLSVSPSLVIQEKLLEKPVTSLLSIDIKREETDSFEYSISENTDRIEEMSFRVSEAVHQRFPRFSAASITVFESPCKEIKKSFVEYTELADSPNYCVKEHLPSTTPIDSPKQSLLSINEVRNILNGIEGVEKEGSSGKYLRANRGSRTKLEFDDELKNSARTEITTSSSDSCKANINCEGKNPSCHCSTCLIM